VSTPEQEYLFDEIVWASYEPYEVEALSDFAMRRLPPVEPDGED